MFSSLVLAARFRVLLAYLLLSCSLASASAADYFQVIDSAISADPLLQSQSKQIKAWQQQAVASEQWQDPKVALSWDNLPVNGFDIHQEAMTQFKVGISQQLPRGDTLEIKAAQQRLKGDIVQWQAQNRHFELSRDVGNHWLMLHLAYTSKGYLQQSRDMFSKLIEVTRSQYATGQKRLQDVVRAEVELTRLDLRISQVEGNIAMLQAGFARWLPASQNVALQNQKLPSLNISPKLLNLTGLALHQQLSKHPKLQAAQQHISLSDKNTELAKQRYEPAYAVKASYGLRADAPGGGSGAGSGGAGRADLFSIGIQFELPIFTDSKQDRQVEAAILTSGAKTLDKVLLLQQMGADYYRHKAKLGLLQQQFGLYQDTLIAQLYEQSQTTLSAYNSDLGDFSEVMSATIDELNGLIALAQIKIQLLQQANNINYLFGHSGHFSQGAL
ncbi:MAG: outer membrane protein TolC [Phenylobacterium sp.]|jgi:outer membrane protein TolC